MEEENKPEVEEVQAESKKVDFKSVNYKKYLPYAGIALAIVAIIIIVVSVLGGGPKKAVKSFVKGFNKQDADMIIKSVDYAGIRIWYNYDEDDFSKDDYEEFVDEYKDIDEDEIEEQNEYIEENLEDSFDEISDEYKSYKIKIDKFKSQEKLGKDLYVIKAKISVEAKPKDKEDDEIDESEIVTFVVYKNKLISLGGISL